MRAQLDEEGQEPVGVGFGEGRRGLVEDQEPRALGQGLGDLHHLLLPDAQLVDLGVRIHLEAHAGEGDPGFVASALPVHETTLHALAAQEQVLRHRETRHQGELLGDDGDAVILGLAQAGEPDLVALEHDLAAVGARRVDPGQDLDERALARAVLAAQGEDLAAFQVEGDPVQGPDAGEVLGELAELEKGQGPRGHFFGGGLGHCSRGTSL